MNDKIVAIVPARDEEPVVAETVRALAGFVPRVIVVDDGSSDRTIAQAGGAGARVVRLKGNRGKGTALAAGIQAAGTAELLLLCDADLGSSAEGLSVLLAPLESGTADMTIAAPPPSGPSGFGVVEAVARRGIRRCTGRTFARPLSGQRAMRAEVAKSLEMASGFGAEVGMTIDAILAGFHVVEVPCSFTHAATGRDLAGFSHRGRQGADVVAALAPRLLRARSQGVIVGP